MNSPKEIAQSIQGAKDNYGLITTDALHQQLNNLTATDWRTAAQTFTKEKAGADGFYIEDSSTGAVTIHNDVRPATSVADESLNQATINDIKSNVGGFAAGLSIPSLGVGGATGFMALIDGASEGAAIVAGGEAGVVALAAAPIMAGIFYGVDYSTNKNLKADAQSELSMGKTLTFQS
jgi:hypothetical protein